MKRLSLAPAMIVLALGIGACRSSPPADYYVLTADAAPAMERGGPTLGIAALDVAEYLSRQEIVMLEGEHRLRIDPYQRWAEPLDDGIRRTLLLNLSALLGSDGVRGMPWPRDWAPQWLLRCSIARLDVREDVVELVAVWSLQDGPRARAAMERTTRLTRPRSSAAIDSVAADISQVLLELSQEISGAISAAAVPAPAE